ncbi:ABC transporter permease [Adhaeribacter arboris]|uniref:ABC transporter permease n=2 Tax=Adhaeribacter arboris TaxID=2072846 RepID=A0A2T2YNN9_9BACT|nr:ABC transporter permease [Adhaeribacter arboris]
MIRNYLTIAFRNLLRQKAYSFLNIGGLALGMAVALLIGLWLQDELSYNTYHANYTYLAKVMKRGNDKGRNWSSTSLQYPLATELQTTYKSHFQHIVKASWVQDYILSSGETKISSTGVFMEAAAPEMFTLKMLKGNWSALQDPHSIVLSASSAKALFGNQDPLGKIVKMNTKVQVQVTGVYEDLPRNTELHEIKFFAPFSLWASLNDWIAERALNDWTNHFLYLYVQIKPTSSLEQVSARIKDAELNQIKKLEGLQKQVALQPQVFLHPMPKWHLFSDFEEGKPQSSSVRFVWLVGLIGSFVLLLACINFMNLSTARSSKRAKEVGVRKTLGSLRTQLIGQFFSESYLIVFLAFGLALVLAKLGLPYFNEIAAKDMRLPWNQGWFWLGSILFILITGLLAGSYPALYLSSFNPVKVLKGTFRAGRLASLHREVMVVMQFTISVTLIICTIIVYNQIMFAKNRPVGYARDGLITMDMKSDDFYGKYDVLRTELKNTGVVAEMSQSMGKITEVASGNNGFQWKGKDPNRDDSFGTLAVSHEHGKTVGWQFVAGRDFSREYASDSVGMVINEAAAKFMGLKNPVGESVSWTWWRTQEVKHYKILGVIKDMVMESPYEPVEPTVFYLKGFNGTVNCINIKINPAVSAREALPKIETVFKKLIPSAPFEYQFVDEEYAKKFATEERIGKLAALFASLAIIISCLGLFGLASFAAEQRTKEIGVRKVLGASIGDVWLLLSKDFMRLIAIALGIAVPSAFYFMHHWLQNYEYRVRIEWWIFALAGTGAISITLLTVSYQSIRAARLNPARSLRTE